jgi:hypothetical protein
MVSTAGKFAVLVDRVEVHAAKNKSDAAATITLFIRKFL